jgi:CheY-like chemotaxis protein/anti-sigma regulatory factor (Ser/Thr protein kinase)
LALPESRIALDADPLRLAQVFHCLLDNACKFTEQGGEIRVEVGLQAGVVRVSVADTGIGIDSGDLGRIFEMFVQAGTTGERTQEGLGIGLALARALAGLHGGEIEAQSEGPGRGSRFVVRLPAAPEGLGSAAPAVSLATAAPGSIRLPEPAAPARRVLVADDNPDLVDSLATLLRLSGFEVETARDGLEAVAAALRFRPSLILLDLGMPRLDGYSACRRIRELPGGQSIAILAQTGWGQEEDRQRSLDAGFDGHLIKPVDPMALIRIAMDSPPSLA